MFLRYLAVLSSGILALGTLAAASAADKSAGLNENDQKFVQEAARGGADEVTMGKIAVKKAADPKVKAFGQRMITDHSKAGKELQALAKRKGWTMDTGVPENHDDITSKTGADFDKAYVADMVKDHEKDVADFEKEAKEAADPDLKAFVTQTLPTLKEHLSHARSLQ